MSSSSSGEVESSAAALETSDPRAPAAYESPDDLVAGVPADAHFCAGVLSATPIPGFNLDFDLSLLKNDEGVEVAVVGNGSVAILGTMSALAV